jgi:hypothetical protein
MFRVKLYAWGGRPESAASHRLLRHIWCFAEIMRSGVYQISNRVVFGIEALFVGAACTYVVFLILQILRGRVINVPIRVIDLFILSKNLSTSAAQIQKSYDWQITQWSGFGTAVLTATLGFISAAGLDIWKGAQLPHESNTYTVIGIGIVSSLALYALCQYRVARLRARFSVLYGALALLS